MSFILAYLILLQYCYLFIAFVKVIYYCKSYFKDLCKLRKLYNIAY